MKLRSLIPELEGATQWLNGEVQRSQLIGEKPTLFHFWSVSCHICKVAIGGFHGICDRYQDQLNVISVHMPLKESDTDLLVIEKVAKDLNLSQPVFIDNERILSDKFENKYVPAYYLFDQTGALRHYQAGGGGMKVLENRLIRILEEVKK